MSTVPKVTVTFKMETTDDDSPDVSYLEQDCFDDEAGRARLAAFRAGDWYMIGIRAVATIWIERANYRTNYTIESPGLWGIESDSDASYLQEVFAEECAQLRADIEAMKEAEFKS